MSDAALYHVIRWSVENLRIRRIAIPTFTHKGHPTVLGDQQFQHGLFQDRPVVFRIAMGDRNGLCIAFGHIVATEGKARCVEMVEALIKAFSCADRQGEFTK